MRIHGGERSIARTSPMEIAHHPLFTAREKIDLLNLIKAEVTGEDVNLDDLDFAPDEIDEAIEEIKTEAEDGGWPGLSIDGGYHGHNDN